jgi:hypothetical protein
MTITQQRLDTILVKLKELNESPEPSSSKLTADFLEELTLEEIHQAVFSLGKASSLEINNLLDFSPIMEAVYKMVGISINTPIKSLPTNIRSKIDDADFLVANLKTATQELVAYLKH